MKEATIKTYVTAIYGSGGKREFVRTIDLANVLKCKSSSVTEMFQKMSRKGLVRYTPYRGVKLTRKGKDLAEEVIGRQKVLLGLLIYLDVPQELAESESKNLEPVIDDRTIGYIRVFLKGKVIG